MVAAIYSSDFGSCCWTLEIGVTHDTSRRVLPSDGLVPLESVLCTEELNRRPSRPRDYETENRALVLLVRALADSPRVILQTLAETILEDLAADSAGVSLLTKEDGGREILLAGNCRRLEAVHRRRHAA